MIIKAKIASKPLMVIMEQFSHWFMVKIHYFLDLMIKHLKFGDRKMEENIYIILGLLLFKLSKNFQLKNL